LKQTFRGYYRPTILEFTALWKDAIFALDANVLLNVYGYSPSTRKALLTLLGAVSDRLWIPHQFAAEFQRNRAKVIVEQVSNYQTVRNQLKKILEQDFRARHKHPFISRKSLAAFESLCRELEKKEKEHQALLSVDSHFERITEILKGKIGPVFLEDELAPLHEEARRRYAKRVPPGYMDDQKPEPDSFGDFLGWRQILDHGQRSKKSLILVTDEQKEDWWYIVKEIRLGPRPELLTEYATISGKDFYMYSVEQFIIRAQEHLGKKIGKEALAEVRDRSAAQLVRDKTLKPLADKIRVAETVPVLKQAAEDLSDSKASRNETIKSTQKRESE